MVEYLEGGDHDRIEGINPCIFPEKGIKTPKNLGQNSEESRL
jgi:hypothetical protein